MLRMRLPEGHQGGVLANSSHMTNYITAQTMVITMRKTTMVMAMKTMRKTMRYSINMVKENSFGSPINLHVA